MRQVILNARRDDHPVILTFRDKTGERRVRARIDWTEVREEGLYFGYSPLGPGPLACLWGTAWVRLWAVPFGLVAVEQLVAVERGQ